MRIAETVVRFLEAAVLGITQLLGPMSVLQRLADTLATYRESRPTIEISSDSRMIEMRFLHVRNSAGSLKAF